MAKASRPRINWGLLIYQHNSGESGVGHFSTRITTMLGRESSTPIADRFL